MENYLYDIALTYTDKVGSVTASALIEEYGDADNLFNKSAADLVEMGIKLTVAQALSIGTNVDRAMATIKLCREKGVKIFVKGKSEDYPTLLSECVDAPHVLYQYGDIDLNSHRLVSIVGTRKATEGGIENTRTVVKDLAEAYPDIVIVSGLAFGIDKAAHKAAMDNNVPTAAFLPGWVLDITPKTHVELARSIVRKGGAVLSDMAPGTVITKGNFLSRNRLIAGISSATIVIESPDRGGSTSTATIAASYSRAVFALPGRSTDVNSGGTNLLIKTSRAILYQDCSDLAVELGWERKNRKQVSEEEISKLTPALRRMCESMDETETYTLDELAELNDTELGKCSSSLIRLETLGIVKSIPGGLYMKSRF